MNDDIVKISTGLGAYRLHLIGQAEQDVERFYRAVEHIKLHDFDNVLAIAMVSGDLARAQKRLQELKNTHG